MSGFLREEEQKFEGGGNNQGGDSGGYGGNNQGGDGGGYGGNNQGGDGGGYGGGNNQGGDSGGYGNNQQGGNDQQQQKSSGGFMEQAKTTGEDGMINTEINKFATNEGLPAGADGFVDAAVDQEANKFL